MSILQATVVETPLPVALHITILTASKHQVEYRIVSKLVETKIKGRRR